MTNQPEALRLADELLAMHGPTDIDERAAAELRRLHTLNQELLEALKRVLRHIPTNAGGASLSDDVHRAQKAIAKAEGEKQ